MIISTTPVAGVWYVHIHLASGLQSANSDGLSDPYCLVLANKKKGVVNVSGNSEDHAIGVEEVIVVKY